MAMLNPNQIEAVATANTLRALARNEHTEECELFLAAKEVMISIGEGDMPSWVIADLVDELRRNSKGRSEVETLANLFECSIEYCAMAERERFHEEWSLYRWSDLLEKLVLVQAFSTEDEAERMLNRMVEESESWGCSEYGYRILDETRRFRKGDEVCMSTFIDVYVISEGQPVHFDESNLRAMHLL